VGLLDQRVGLDRPDQVDGQVQVDLLGIVVQVDLREIADQQDLRAQPVIPGIPGILVHLDLLVLLDPRVKRVRLDAPVRLD
jgi:hypothetical protein